MVSFSLLAACHGLWLLQLCPDSKNWSWDSTQVFWLQLHAFSPLRGCISELSGGSESWASLKLKLKKIENYSVRPEAARPSACPFLEFINHASLHWFMVWIVFSEFQLSTADTSCACPSSYAIMGEITAFYVVNLYPLLFSKLSLPCSLEEVCRGERAGERRETWISC